MDKKKIRIAIAAQISNMLVNDIIIENVTEPFNGWLEDGDVFINNGYTEEETEEIMKEVKKISPEVDALAQSLIMKIA